MGVVLGVCGLTLEEGGVGRVGMGYCGEGFGNVWWCLCFGCSVRGGELGKERGRGKWVLGL